MTDEVLNIMLKRPGSMVGRRGALAVLGIGAFGALRTPSAAGAGKAGKKVRKTCGKQRGPCEAFTRDLCEGDEDCLARRLPCCGALAKCQFAAFVACVSEDVPDNLSALGRRD